MAASSNDNSRSSISLSSLAAIVSSLAVFTSPIYLLGLLELQRLYLLAYRLSRDTAWHAAYLTPTTITTREGLSLAFPAIALAIPIGVFALLIAVGFWEIVWNKSVLSPKQESVTLRKLREQKNGLLPKSLYVSVYVCTAVVCVLVYHYIYTAHGLSNAPSWARETGAPWWAFTASGLIAALGACIPVYGYVRDVAPVRWLTLAIVLTYVPALFTAYWDSVKPGRAALDALPLPEVVLCIKNPSAATNLPNSNLPISSMRSDAVWGDLVDNSNGYWHVLVNEYYNPTPGVTLTREYVKSAAVKLYSWGVHPSDQLAYIPDDSVGRVIAPNAIPPQLDASTPDVCHAPLPYELLPDPKTG